MNRFVMVFLIFLAFTRNASAALSTNIMVNCAIDYFAHCSQYPVNSSEVKDCFRKVGSKLQPTCVKALNEENMITEEDRAKAKEEKAQELQPFKGAPIYKESQLETIKKVKENISSKIKSIQKKFSSKKTYVTYEKSGRKRKLQKGGKWDGYTLYVEWNDGGKREYGGELTLYGYEDRN